MTAQNLIDCIRANDILGKLPEQEIEQLAEDSTNRSIRKNTIIVSAGDPTDSVHLIASGKVRVFRENEDGRQIIINTLGGGEMFGELAALSGAPRAASIEAIEQTRTLVIKKEQFLKLLERNPKIAIELSKKCAELVQVMSDHLSDVALLDVYGRLTGLFSRFASEIDGMRIVQGYTHQDLANSIGASREMVSRIISGLKKGNYISTNPDKKEITLERKLPKGW